MTLLTPSLSKKRNVENVLDTNQQLQKCSLPYWISGMLISIAILRSLSYPPPWARPILNAIAKGRARQTTLPFSYGFSLVRRGLTLAYSRVVAQSLRRARVRPRLTSFSLVENEWRHFR